MYLFLCDNMVCKSLAVLCKRRTILKARMGSAFYRLNRSPCHLQLCSGRHRIRIVCSGHMDHMGYLGTEKPVCSCRLWLTDAAIVDFQVPSGIKRNRTLTKPSTRNSQIHISKCRTLESLLCYHIVYWGTIEKFISSEIVLMFNKVTFRMFWYQDICRLLCKRIKIYVFLYSVYAYHRI